MGWIGLSEVALGSVPLIVFPHFAIWVIPARMFCYADFSGLDSQDGGWVGVFNPLLKQCLINNVIRKSILIQGVDERIREASCGARFYTQK